MPSQPPTPDRDYGKSWRDRLRDARSRAARQPLRLDDQGIARLHEAASSFDVSSPADRALFWSGRDVLTGISLQEGTAGGPLWWDKLAPLDAQVLRDLGLAFTLEDTECGRWLLDLGLDPSPQDPLSVEVRRAWEIASERFAMAVRGRIEVLAVGAWEDGVFRGTEWDALLGNRAVTCVNGLDRALLPDTPEEAFRLIRCWDVERNRRYVRFLDQAADATPRERATALDDYRETQLWFEQDFFADLGPDRALPALPPAVAAATDRALETGTWKYARSWRDFVEREP
jgi:hypothetical protein